MPDTDTTRDRPAGEPYLAAHDTGGGTTVLADARRTAGAFGVVVRDLRAGESGAWYRSATTDLGYLVLDGAIEVRVADRVLDARAVSLVLAPRGAPHCFRACSDARVALVAVPAGFEQFLEASSRAPADDAALLLALAQEHHVQVLPDFLPDPALSPAPNPAPEPERKDLP